MILLGIAFAIIAAHTPATLAQVTTGRLAAIAGITAAGAALFAFSGLLLVLYVVARRPGERMRAVLSYTIGVFLFAVAFLATDRWVTRQIPARLGTAQADMPGVVTSP
jgi:hypothetical protein